MFDVDPAEGAVRFRTWVQKPKGRCAGLNAKRQTPNFKLGHYLKVRGVESKF